MEESTDPKSPPMAASSEGRRGQGSQFPENENMDVDKHDENEEQEHHHDAKEEPLPITPKQQYYVWFLSDVLMYICVLNLAAELVPDTVVVDRFSISMFVGVTLKLLLDLIQWLEHKIQHFFCVHLERKCLGGFFMWLVVFLSKFLFLWFDDVIFTSHVELGGFIAILILSACLMLSAKLNRFIYDRIGKWERKRLEEQPEKEPEQEQMRLGSSERKEESQEATAVEPAAEP